MRIEQTDIYECGHSLYFLIDDDSTPSSSSYSVEVQSILIPVSGHCGCYNPDFCPDCDTPQPAPLSSALPPHIIRNVGVRHECDDERMITEDIEPDDVRFPEDLRPKDEELRVEDAMSPRSYEKWLADVSARFPSSALRRTPWAPSRTTSMDDLSDSGEVRFHVAPRTLDEQLGLFTLSDRKLKARKRNAGKGKDKAPAKSVKMDVSPSYASSAISPHTIKERPDGAVCKMTMSKEGRHAPTSSHPHPIKRDPSPQPHTVLPRSKTSPAAQDILQETNLLERYIKYMFIRIADTEDFEERLDIVDQQYDHVTKKVAELARDHHLPPHFKYLKDIPDLEQDARKAVTELEMLEDIRKLVTLDDAYKHLQSLEKRYEDMKAVLEALLEDESEGGGDKVRRGGGSSHGERKVEKEKKSGEEPHLRGGAHWADGCFIPSPTPSPRPNSIYDFDLDSRYGSEASYHSPDSLDGVPTPRPTTRHQPRPAIFSRLRESLRSPRQLCIEKGKGRQRAQSFAKNYHSPFAESVADSYDYDGEHSPQGSFIWVPYSSREHERSRSPFTSSRSPLPSIRLARSPPPYSGMQRTSSMDLRPPPGYNPRRTSSTDTRPPAKYSLERGSSMIRDSRPSSPPELPTVLTPPRKSSKGKGKQKARASSIDMDCSSSCACSPSSPSPSTRENIRNTSHRYIPHSPTLSSLSQNEKEEQRWAKLKNVAVLRILPHVPKALQGIITELDMIERRSCFIHHILDQGEKKTNQQHQILSTKMYEARLKFDAAMRDHEDDDLLHIAWVGLRQDLPQEAQDAGLEFETCNRMLQDMDNVPPELHARRELEVLERWKHELLDELAAVMGEGTEKKLREWWR